MKEELKQQKKTIRGNGAMARKRQLTDQYAERQRPIDLQLEELTGQLEKLQVRREEINEESDRIDKRDPIRPVLGLWRGYRRKGAEPPPPTPHTHFDTDLLVLTHQQGPRLPLEATLQVAQALRGAVMSQCGVQPVPEWVSGHTEEGTPSEREDGHLALIPLPFVGHEHADGHILGLALAFPRSIDRRERGTCLGPLLVDAQGQPKTVELKLGSLGNWTLAKRDWSEPRNSLKPETWTSIPDGATVWASVTPVVLDRFPKTERIKDRLGWNEEVAGIVKQACIRIGLPEPVEIDLDTTSWHRGAPRAVGKRRRLRNGGEGSLQYADAPLGDGFPPFPAKGTNSPRLQIHVWLRFEEPVVGPVLIGAGRYVGYGFLKPLRVARKGGQS